MRGETNQKSVKLSQLEKEYRTHIIQWLYEYGIPVSSIARIMNIHVSTTSRIIDSK